MRLLLRHIRQAVPATRRYVRNTLRGWSGSADYERWSSPEGLEIWWVERTKLLAAFIAPNTRLIEFGAGRRQLEALLPPGCVYTPSDLVSRGDGTLVCDLNQRPLPDLSQVRAEVAVFGGVLEYLRDVKGIAQWLASSDVSVCILSFEPVPMDLRGFARRRELARRRYFGYMNNSTEEELLAQFAAVGYTCKRRETWTSQIILQFCQSVDTNRA